MRAKLAVLVAAEQLDERGHEVAAGGDAAEVEVEDDPPAPLRVGNEEIHGRTSPSPGAVEITAVTWRDRRVGIVRRLWRWSGGRGCHARRRNENSTPSPVSIAAKIRPEGEDSGTLRLGSFGRDGRP